MQQQPQPVTPKDGEQKSQEEAQQQKQTIVYAGPHAVDLAGLDMLKGVIMTSVDKLAVAMIEREQLELEEAKIEAQTHREARAHAAAMRREDREHAKHLADVADKQLARREGTIRIVLPLAGLAAAAVLAIGLWKGQFAEAAMATGLFAVIAKLLFDKPEPKPKSTDRKDIHRPVENDGP